MLNSDIESVSSKLSRSIDIDIGNNFSFVKNLDGFILKITDDININAGGLKIAT